MSVRFFDDCSSSAGESVAWYTFLEDDDRNGLAGGYRSNGGAANVDNNWRDNVNSNLAVRLVLSRNIAKFISLCYRSINYFFSCYYRKLDMPEGWKPGESPIVSEAIPLGEPDETKTAVLWSNRLRHVDDVEAQRAWQENGNVIERKARAVFDKLAMCENNGGRLEPVPVGLPDTDLLFSELTRAASDASYQAGEEWQETIEGLRHHATPDGEMNVLEFFASPETSASKRLEWWQKEIAGLFRYTLEKDWARLRDTEEQIPPVMPEEEPTEPGEPSSSDNLPPTQEDELRTSMDPVNESKEGEPQGYFSVHPFWGGYYRENVYEIYQGGDRWMRDARTYREPPKVGALTESHVFRGKVRAGAITPLPLPYGFFLDVNSFEANTEAKIVVDQHGCYSIDARGTDSTAMFTMVIGKPERSTPFAPVPLTERAVAKPYVGAEAQRALTVATGTTLERAGKIKKFVKETLTYSIDDSLNAVYTKHRQGYFAAIEQHKQADCDVANAYYINLLSAAGITARMVTGHYVKNSDHKGAAVMNSGSRHAWTEVWDEVAETWVRFDATPPKDPTLDEERPDEQAEEETCPQPGDYGEQEAPKLSEEELEEWREKLAEAAEQAKEKTAEELKDERFAEENECTVEEATKIRAKLEAARRLRDHKGRIIREHLSDEFQKIVESNYKERPEWKGPVTRSDGEEMEDVVTIGKDVRAGSLNPLGYNHEVTEIQLTQEYGGMDVYVVADRSGSMNEIDATSQKAKKEEQQLALFLLLDSLYGFSYKTEVAAKQDQLISPLSVRSSVVAFQAGNADTIKQLGASWKPKDQLCVWKGLESNVGGGTPAHLGLVRVRKQIKKEIEQEKKQTSPTQNEKKKRLRLVMVFMDGGVDDKASYLAEQQKLEALGVYVSSWGMTESANAVSVYPNGHCVKSVREMIEPVTEHIIEKAQGLKLKQGIS